MNFNYLNIFKKTTNFADPEKQRENIILFPLRNIFLIRYYRIYSKLNEETPLADANVIQFTVRNLPPIWSLIDPICSSASTE